MYRGTSQSIKTKKKEKKRKRKKEKILKNRMK